MYPLFLEINFDNENHDLAVRFCDDLLLPLAAAHPGFISGLVLKTEGTATTLKLLTIWNNRAASEGFRASAEYQKLASSLSGSGLTLGGVEVYELHRWEVAQAGEVRHIRTSVPSERLDEVAQFWQQRGRHVIESASGCVRALGFIDREASEFVLVIWWRSATDAEAFRLSVYHEEEFVRPLGEDVIRLTRSHLEPLESMLLAASRKLDDHAPQPR